MLRAGFEFNKLRLALGYGLSNRQCQSGRPTQATRPGLASALVSGRNRGRWCAEAARNHHPYRSSRVNLGLSQAFPNASLERGLVIARCRNGDNFDVSWPRTYVGWELQFQTNALAAGPGSNWVNVTESLSTNYVSFMRTQPLALYRLLAP